MNNNVYRFASEKAIPKGMRKLVEKYIDVIDSVHREYNYGYDYWIYLKEGYICDPMECGIIHEYTIKDCEMMLKEVRKVEE